MGRIKDSAGIRPHWYTLGSRPSWRKKRRGGWPGSAESTRGLRAAAVAVPLPRDVFAKPPRGSASGQLTNRVILGAFRDVYFFDRGNRFAIGPADVPFPLTVLDAECFGSLRF